jgi:hypothetical protein
MVDMFSRWAVAALLLSAAPAAAQGQLRLQDGQPAGSPSAQAPAQTPARSESPGFFESIGRFFDRSAANFRTGIKGAQDTVNDLGASATDAAKGAATAAKDATDALVKLPSIRFVDGRERCQNAANGSPDCRAAAETICRSKGFAEGKSADTQSTKKCSVQAWLSGRSSTEGGCQMETYVIRAACQ